MIIKRKKARLRDDGYDQSESIELSEPGFESSYYSSSSASSKRFSSKDEEDNNILKGVGIVGAGTLSGLGVGSYLDRKDIRRIDENHKRNLKLAKDIKSGEMKGARDSWWKIWKNSPRSIEQNYLENLSNIEAERQKLLDEAAKKSRKGKYAIIGAGIAGAGILGGYSLKNKNRDK